MHEKVLPTGSLELLNALGEVDHPALAGWILAGGTGLALHLGHRQSEDFDFFRTDGLDREGLHAVFAGLGPYETLQESDRTLTVLSHGVKVSFFAVADPFIHPTHRHRFFAVADVDDIALMKLVAISGRGSRKDFIDLWSILRGGRSLVDLFTELPRKYRSGRINRYHILKSLTWFADAEEEPMPVMLVPCDWEECKRCFIREAAGIVL